MTGMGAEGSLFLRRKRRSEAKKVSLHVPLSLGAAFRLAKSPISAIELTASFRLASATLERLSMTFTATGKRQK